jgi:PAS domain-containing protein
MNTNPWADLDDGRTLPQTIVDTLPEPFLILDGQLRVVVASRSYYSTFKVGRQDVQGRPVYALGDGQWNVLELRARLRRSHLSTPLWRLMRLRATLPVSAGAPCC